MQSPRREPYVAQVARMKNEMRGDYQSHYTESFKNYPTEKVSPLITDYRERYRDVDPAEDNSPYPLSRDPVMPIVRKPYQYHERPDSEQHKHWQDASNRTRFEDSTLKRDIYMEPLPPRNYIEHEKDPPRADPRDQYETYRREHEPTNHGRDPRHDNPYGQLAVGEQQDMTDLKPVFCNRCFKSGVCMNRFTCAHQFCDECMSSCKCLDRPFRDSIRWHFVCDICNSLTSDPKLVRLDPYGRRLPHRPSSR